MNTKNYVEDDLSSNANTLIAEYRNAQRIKKAT